ncbi:MAG: acetyl-CoA carboxylase biotin carboxyl carrier protein [Planctomycetia bacterium]|jgi:acetyl-CoA carboxylase biotin carboxyl carrier protein
MAGAGNQDIFEVRRIRRLVELMKEHDLNEMDIRQDDTRIQLRRGIGGTPVVTTAVPAPAPAPAAPAAPAPAAPAADKPVEDDSKVITSPIVGTFYAAPDPESPPYVKVGDHVGSDTTVCIIEAMKVFNEIPAEISGEITAVLVQNGDPVEFGQPLFKVK